MIFISTDQLPENPTEEDYKKLNWVSVGKINAMEKVAVKTDKFATRGDIRPYGRIIAGKIKKPKHQRFGRILYHKRKDFLFKLKVNVAKDMQKNPA